MILLDTSIIVDYFRKLDKENALFLVLHKSYQLAISTITEYEILNGSLSKKHIEFNVILFEKLSIIDFNRNCAKSTSNIYKTLKAKSQLINLADMLIAGTALANNLPLATLNTKHFTRIKNLKLLELEKYK